MKELNEKNKLRLRTLSREISDTIVTNYLTYLSDVMYKKLTIKELNYLYSFILDKLLKNTQKSVVKQLDFDILQQLDEEYPKLEDYKFYHENDWSKIKLFTYFSFLLEYARTLTLGEELMKNPHFVFGTKQVEKFYTRFINDDQLNGHFYNLAIDLGYLTIKGYQEKSCFITPETQFILVDKAPEVVIPDHIFKIDDYSIPNIFKVLGTDNREDSIIKIKEYTMEVWELFDNNRTGPKSKEYFQKYEILTKMYHVFKPVTGPRTRFS